jgi:hypothetical protein
MTRTTHAIIGLALCALLVPCAQAQDVDRYETVQNRSRPELDPPGVRLGGLTLFPSIDLGYHDVDNIFADDTNEQDDTILKLHPRLNLRSGWSRHQLRVGADLLVARYSDFDKEDYEDLRLWAEGRLDFSMGALSLAARHSDLHEDRSSPDDDRPIEPTEFSTDSFAARYRFETGANFAEAGVQIITLDFDNAMSLTGPINNDDRDRDSIEFTVRGGRQLSSDYSGFVEVRAEQIDYDQEFDDDGRRRSSDTVEILAGTTLDLAGRWFGEVFAGYRSRDYDDPMFQTADGATFGADVTWNVTGLTTLNFSGSREIDSTTIVGASGIEVTRFGIEVDHELLRNLIISLAAVASTENFEGIDRDDDIQRFAAQAKYMMNRNLYLTGGVEHRKRDTSPATSGGREYGITTLFIEVRGQL